MAKKKQKNSGLGRKPLDAGKKKVEVRFFVENRLVEALGGIDETRNVGKTYIEGEAFAVIARSKFEK